MNAAVDRSRRWLNRALAGCLFLLIVGAQWATFDRFGSPMPDWDQWDAEAVNLLIPWFEHDHFVAHLFLPHNEHRVVLTKLQNLTLTLLNGQWDSRVEAASNALLHAALGMAFWIYARRWTGRRWHAALFVFTLSLFALPIAWQNVLGGFHSQQYWLLGLSFAAIVTLPFAPAWSAAWWCGTCAAILVLGSMGSGFLAAAVTLGLVGWRLLRREMTLRAVWPTLAIGSVLVAIGLLTRVEVYYHQQLKAKTAHDFIFSILRSLEWPLRDRDWAGAILWLPWALVAWQVIRGRAALRSAETRGSEIPTSSSMAGQTIAALGGWVLVQLIATAYARGAGADYPASRYMDTVAFGAMVNGTALAWLLSGKKNSGRLRFAGSLLAVAWLVTFGLGLRTLAENNFRYELPDAKKYYTKAESYMRRYLVSNDPRELAYPDIPFPSAQGLIERLAHPSLRALMPVPIRAPLPLSTANQTGAGFLRNDARRPDVDVEHPPRAGLPTQIPPLDALESWGSFTTQGMAATGSWQSTPLEAPLGAWLKFEVAGDVSRSDDHAVTLGLYDPKSGQRLADVRPTKTPGNSWRAAYVRAPHGPFVVKAIDENARQWLAFSPPVEMGALSYVAWQVTKNGLLLVYLAGGCTIVLAGVLWRKTRRAA